jgi:hypothetical protein
VSARGARCARTGEARAATLPSMTSATALLTTAPVGRRVASGAVGPRLTGLLALLLALPLLLLL